MISDFTNPSQGLPGGKRPQAFQKLMLATTREGVGSVAPLEAAVTLGRTFAAWRREGFIEAQERITDEIATAVVWLFGVSFLARFFEKRIKPWLFPNTGHLSGDVAWSKPWGRPTNVDFRPQELLSRNSDDLRKLMLIKSGRLIFSVFIALSLVGYVIPRLNQMKTRWFLKRRKARESTRAPHSPAVPSMPKAALSARPAASGNGQTALPSSLSKPQFAPSSGLYSFSDSRLSVPPSDAATMPSPTAPWRSPIAPETLAGVGGSLNPAWQSPVPPEALAGVGGSLNPAWRPGGMLPIVRAPDLSSISPSIPTPGGIPGYTAKPFPGVPRAGGPLRFGGLASLANGAMQGLGSLIEQTTYGNLLVVDTVITGGRAATAYTRVPDRKNPWEALEFIVRDGLSLYFYMLAQPHLMDWMGRLLDDRLGTCLAVQPEIAAAVHRQIEQRLRALAHDRPELRATLSEGRVPAEVLQEIIHGPREHERTLLQAMPRLEREMRKGKLHGRQGFLPLLGQELAAMQVANANAGRAGKPEEAWHQAVAGFLARRQPGSIATQDVRELLAAIGRGQGAFHSLSDTARADLSIAVKNAFRHTAGLDLPLTPEGVRALPPLAEMLDSLPGGERAALTRRVLHAAHLDGLGQVNTMFRRSLNLARPYLGQNRLSPPKPGQNDLLTRAEALAGWLDKSVRLRLSLEDMLASDIEGILASLPPERMPPSLRHALEAPEALKGGHLRMLESSLSGLSGRKVHKAREALELLKTVAGNAAVTGEFAEATADAARPERPLVDSIRAHAESTFREMATALDSMAPEPVRQLVRRYGETASAYIHGRQGRLVSLYLPEAAREARAQLREMLLGGLKYDYPLTRKAQAIIGQFTPDSRTYAGSAKRQAMRGNIVKYLSQLSKRVARSGNTVALSPLLKSFHRMNRNTHYACRLVSLGLAIAGVGLFVPWLQMAITRRITGRDENPGIAQARQALGMAGPQPSGHSATVAANATANAHTLPATLTGEPLRRGNFQAFKPQGHG